MQHEDVLARFIDEVCAGTSELVINGDFVDFLAEDHHGWHAFLDDPDAARQVLERIMDDDERPTVAVFDALARLVARKTRLTILLGNHDIELSYRPVQDSLLRRIGAGDIRFIFDNDAYRVAPNALIEHGNRYDTSNRVDHDGLRRYRSLRSRDASATPAMASFSPPPGSQLVADVMNPIKQRYRFIDLLKPETAPLFALILALEPGLRSKLGDIAKFLIRSVRHRSAANAMPAFQGDAAVTTSDPNVVALGTWFGPELDAYGSDMAARDTLAAATAITELLVWPGGDLLARAPQFKRALRALDDDETFVLSAESKKSPYRIAAEHLTRVRDGHRICDYVVFGHTHLARRVELDTGATYINTGTWAGLMQYPRNLADDDARLTTFLQDIRDNRFERMFRPRFARIEIDDRGLATATTLEPYQ